MNKLFLIPFLLLVGCTGEIKTGNKNDSIKTIYSADFISISELTYDTNKYIIVCTGHGAAICPKTINH